MEDLAATLGASMMAASRLAVEADTGRATLLFIRVGCGCLDVTSIAEHGHLDTDLGNALVLLVVVNRGWS